LAYAHGLGPCGETRGGSSPLSGTFKKDPELYRGLNLQYLAKILTIE